MGDQEYRLAILAVKDLDYDELKDLLTYVKDNLTPSNDISNGDWIDTPMPKTARFIAAGLDY